MGDLWSSGSVGAETFDETATHLVLKDGGHLREERHGIELRTRVLIPYSSLLSTAEDRRHRSSRAGARQGRS